MSAVVRAQGLGKRYGRRWALSGCTLEIPAGRVVGLVGPKGAGKTTLARTEPSLAASVTSRNPHLYMRTSPSRSI